MLSRPRGADGAEVDGEHAVGLNPGTEGLGGEELLVEAGPVAFRHNVEQRRPEALDAGGSDADGHGTAVHTHRPVVGSRRVALAVAMTSC